MQVAFDGLFPRDDPKNTRFAINFFTSIGLGGLTWVDSISIMLHLFHWDNPTLLLSYTYLSKVELPCKEPFYNRDIHIMKQIFWVPDKCDTVQAFCDDMMNSCATKLKNSLHFTS